MGQQQIPFGMPGEIPGAELAEIDRAFTICDEKGTGALDRNQMAFYLRALGQNPTNAEIKALPDSTNAEAAAKYYQDHRVEEEVANTEEKAKAVKDHICELFKVWDSPKPTGTIPFSDLEQCLKIFGSATGDEFSKEEIAKLKQVAGVDGDNFDYNKFADLMTLTQKPHTESSLVKENDPDHPWGQVAKGGRTQPLQIEDADFFCVIEYSTVY